MKTTTKRTLVKSAPELWELADDESRLEAWMAELLGAAEPVPVRVTGRSPERALSWSAEAGAGGRAQPAAIAIELAESGFGTAVSITARHEQADPAAALAALEGLLDELAAPERRPFSGD